MEILGLVKKSLSIVDSSTFKDEEINMLINSAILDLKRQGINTDKMDDLVKFAIVMYVKGNFGMVDENEKKLSMSRYHETITNLALSGDYKVVE